MQEIDASKPGHLRDWWTPDMACLHSAAFEFAGATDVERPA